MPCERGNIHVIPGRAGTVTTGPERSPRAIFSNAAARKYGFTIEF